MKVCTVVGFPLGANATVLKVEETRQAVRDDAEEIDVVINIEALKAGDAKLVEDEIRAVVKAAEGRLVKVVIEACLLTREEKILAYQLSENAGAQDMIQAGATRIGSSNSVVIVNS